MQRQPGLTNSPHSPYLSAAAVEQEGGRMQWRLGTPTIPSDTKPKPTSLLQ